MLRRCSVRQCRSAGDEASPQRANNPCGETILVTDRDQVVAELGPARRRKTVPGSLEDVLQRPAEEETITRARVPKEKGWTWKVKGLGLPAGTAQAILDELREDRV